MGVSAALTPPQIVREARSAPPGPSSFLPRVPLCSPCPPDPVPLFTCPQTLAEPPRSLLSRGALEVGGTRSLGPQPHCMSLKGRRAPDMGVLAPWPRWVPAPALRLSPSIFRTSAFLLLCLGLWHSGSLCQRVLPAVFPSGCPSRACLFLSWPPPHQDPPCLVLVLQSPPCPWLSPASAWVSGSVPRPNSLPSGCVALCLWPRVLPRLSS